MSVIIPRSVWKPQYANGFAVIGVDEWLAAGKELWLHHSVTNPPGPDATLEEDCAHMREFEAIGQSRFGGGISYTWVVMPSGRIFEGHSLDRQGSHTYMRNNKSRAICLAGKYHLNALPQRMQNSVALLLRELDATIDGPHSAVYATDCPGEYARSKIPSMNALALNGQPIGEDEEDMDGQQNAYLVEIWEATSKGVGKPQLSVLQQHVNFLGNLILAGNADLKAAILGLALNLDEDALAAALIERGFDGANVAELKAAFVDVLRRGVDSVETPEG